MAIKVKPAADVVAKWLEVTPQRQSYYAKGAVGAGGDWEAGATAAASAFRAGVTAGNIEALFKGGIKRAGAAKYNRKVETVGVARFGQGVQAAGPDYEVGIAPMLATIAALTLSPRGPRGAPGNLTRVTEIATALNKKRLQLRAVGA